MKFKPSTTVVVVACVILGLGWVLFFGFPLLNTQDEKYSVRLGPNSAEVGSQARVAEIYEVGCQVISMGSSDKNYIVVVADNTCLDQIFGLPTPGKEDKSETK